LNEWKNPLVRDVEIGDPDKFLASLQSPLTHDGYACFLCDLLIFFKKKSQGAILIIFLPVF
jgi:hypothetical protein